MKTSIRVFGALLGIGSLAACSAEQPGSDLAEEDGVSSVSQATIIPATGSPTAASYPASCVVEDSGVQKMLVAGGFDPTGAAVASTYLFDPATNTWTSAGTLATARGRAEMIALGSGKCLITGGRESTTGDTIQTAELFTAGSGWSSAGTMVTDVVGHTLHQIGSRVVAIAGAQVSGSTVTPLETIQVWDGMTTWLNLQDGMNDFALDNARAYHASLAMPSGSNTVLYISSGIGLSGNAIAATEKLTINSTAGYVASSRADTGDLDTPRHGHVMYPYKSGGGFEVVVAGGYDTSNDPLDSIEKLNGTTWTATANALPLPCGDLKIVKLGAADKYQLVGGETFHGFSCDKAPIWDNTEATPRFEDSTGAPGADTLAQGRYGLAVEYLEFTPQGGSATAKVFASHGVFRPDVHVGPSILSTIESLP